MALDYYLDLATSWPAPQVARELHAVGDRTGLVEARYTTELMLGDGALTPGGTWFRVCRVGPRRWPTVIDGREFTETVAVAFTLDKRDTITAMDEVVHLAAGLLRRVPGDAVLHFQSEVIWLLRRDGDLSLDERADHWTPERLAAVATPYRRLAHSFTDESGE
ncbi:hypothetical protein P3T35_000875 [Kitasatospora sp. GP30]|uniref:SitI3 family protein n=1 Tax=Kitasatospora sp. GP30 TaxID=3035084 RepID=UPI000C70203F|nr:SitI3 family protein [Kitasatospora sp. GP30]MDH6138886.1 hypothetical protein [Kitasatospora sp. GP30]